MMTDAAECAETVPIENVRPSPYRVRVVMDVATLRRLEEEARRTRTVEPVVVWERFDQQGQFVVMEGEWRRRVAVRAGLKSLPVLVRPVEDERDAEIQTLVAELRTWGHTPVAEGEAYARLVGLGMTQTQIAKAVHRDKSMVSYLLRLPKLPEDVRVLIDAGVLNAKQGRELYRFVEWPGTMRQLVRRTLAEELSSAKLARIRPEDVGVAP